MNSDRVIIDEMIWEFERTIIDIFKRYDTDPLESNLIGAYMIIQADKLPMRTEERNTIRRLVGRLRLLDKYGKCLDAEMVLYNIKEHVDSYFDE